MQYLYAPEQQKFGNFMYRRPLKTTNMKSFLLGVCCLLSQSFLFAQYQYFGTYTNQGKPNYLVTPDDVLTAPFRTRITNTLPELRPVPVYNPRLISDTLSQTLNTKCNADVWITFVDEGATYLNALGYYTFPVGSPLNTAPAASAVKIIFPNASKPGNGGELNPGNKVYLGNFPTNTAIGFVLIADGWAGSSGVGNGKWKLYSESRFNPETDPTKKKHSVMLNDVETGRIIIGFEDIRRDGYGSDEDFNDVLFYATVQPRTCVANPDLPDLYPDGNIVYSGNTGGVESKSLGDIIGLRNFRKARNGEHGDINYANATELIGGKHLKQLLYQTDATTPNSTPAYTLADLMPQQMIDTGYRAFISSPTDLTAFTNAKEIISVDFTKNNQARAVAFATRTSDSVYNHTKHICDRLRGAELVNMELFKLRGFDFVRYTLKRENGAIEFATHFSVGTSKGSNSFRLQSNWLNKDYVQEDTLYNYQLWAAAPYLVTDMVLDILDKLATFKPLTSIPAKPLPNTYLIYGKRAAGKLQVQINNQSNATTASIEIEERKNEYAQFVRRTIQVPINPNGRTNLELTVDDAHEANIILSTANTPRDVVYLSDGIWGVDYNATKTTITDFKVLNNPNRQYVNNEFPLLRDIQLKANTSDYLTLYKIMNGGGAEQDMRQYKSIAFTAKFNAPVTITLVKKSISNWTDHYTYTLPAKDSLKEYSINLSKFTSPLSKNPIQADDILQTVFTFETGGKQVSLDAQINNAAFSTFEEILDERLNIVQAYPNPGTKFQINFHSNSAQPLTLRVIESATGRAVRNLAFTSAKGANQVSLDLSECRGQVLLLKLEGKNTRYELKKLVVQ